MPAINVGAFFFKISLIKCTRQTLHIGYFEDTIFHIVFLDKILNSGLLKKNT